MGDPGCRLDGQRRRAEGAEARRPVVRLLVASCPHLISLPRQPPVQKPTKVTDKSRPQPFRGRSSADRCVRSRRTEEAGILCMPLTAGPNGEACPAPGTARAHSSLRSPRPQGHTALRERAGVGEALLSLGCWSCADRRTDGSAQRGATASGSGWSPASGPPLPAASSFFPFCLHRETQDCEPRRRAETWDFLPRREEGQRPRERGTGRSRVTASRPHSAPVLTFG